MKWNNLVIGLDYFNCAIVGFFIGFGWWIKSPILLIVAIIFAITFHWYRIIKLIANN